MKKNRHDNSEFVGSYFDGDKKLMLNLFNTGVVIDIKKTIASGLILLKLIGKKKRRKVRRRYGS